MSMLCKKMFLWFMTKEEFLHLFLLKPNLQGKRISSTLHENLTLYITDLVKFLLKTKTLLFDLRCKLSCTVKTIVVAKHV